jgi:acyl carrier protein
MREHMTDQEKFNFLKSAFNDLFKKELPDINRDTPIQDLGLDSLDIVELQMEFEKRYNVEIPDPENDIRTVGHLLDHLNA